MPMKNTDGFVLNWDKIMKGATAQHKTKYGSGNSTRSVNKGILFEDLVEKLIKAMFPNETWRRTAESYDGKKDFVFPAEEYLADQKWAECKNYSSNLSLNIIAPTLIMGAIENIECIFIFSYSPLNDNAIEGLLNYSEREGRKVQIFDGTLLECLICKYHTSNGIEDFFPGTDFDLAYVALKKKQLRAIQTLRDTNGNKIASSHRFELGERFYIQTVIQNLTWESIDCEISFLPDNKALLNCESNKQYLSIPAAELSRHSILCEALREGTSSFAVEIVDQGTQQAVKKIHKKIDITDEPYLAWSGENALATLTECLDHLNKKINSPLLIAGESGTGKSTLINILLGENNVREKYQVLKVDLSLPRNTCMRALFSQTLGIYGKEVCPKEQADDDRMALSLLVDNYAKSSSEIAERVMTFYDHAHPYLFVVDDIQKISSPYITLFQEFDDLATRNRTPIFYILALNENESTVTELLSRLNWDENYQNRAYKLVRLTKFTKQDILVYLKTRFGLKDVDQFFEGFDGEISPLVLHSFCAGLKAGHVIARIPDGRTYQIIDRFQFAEGVKRILYGKVPLKTICNSLDRNGVSEYILKYLYVADSISSKIESRYRKTIEKLIDQGVLKQTGDAITFYHNEIRKVIQETLIFTEDDYADIFDDPGTNDGAKAICVLEQLEKLKGGELFLHKFLRANTEIESPGQRDNICRLIFLNAEKLSSLGLLSDGLYFVRVNYRALNMEHGHASFFRLLKLIADTSLRCHWDLDNESVENMAFFIKKFFDRALSSYNYEDCLRYFEKYEKLFSALRNISEHRRNFWLAHYANRAAIALDRGSFPLSSESLEVATLYQASHTYCERAGACNALALQLVVDDFNRHYVYRHDLTADIVRDSLEQLKRIQIASQEDPLNEPIVLEYHLILLEYLRCLMDGSSVKQLECLLGQVGESIRRCSSSFYGIKLRTMEIYILIGLNYISEADERLSSAFEYAYKKELRVHIYRLTYIRTQLLLFQNNFSVSADVYHCAALTLAQMLDVHGKTVSSLRREIFLLLQLGKIIMHKDPGRLTSLTRFQEAETQQLLEDLIAFLQGNPLVQSAPFEMKSYFDFCGTDFPTI